MSQVNPTLITFIFYIIAMVGIGLYAYKATSELFPDNNFGEFEFMYVFAFLESRYGETLGYDVTEDVVRAEFQLLGEYYTEIKNIGNLKEVTLTFEDLKARCFEVIPQFE